MSLGHAESGNQVGQGSLSQDLGSPKDEGVYVVREHGIDLARFRQFRQFSLGFPRSLKTRQRVSPSRGRGRGRGENDVCLAHEQVLAMLTVQYSIPISSSSFLNRLLP